MDFDEPSYDDLKEQVAALELVTVEQAADAAELRAELAARDARIAELEARLTDLEQSLRRRTAPHDAPRNVARASSPDPRGTTSPKSTIPTWCSSTRRRCAPSAAPISRPPKSSRPSAGRSSTSRKCGRSSPSTKSSAVAVRAGAR